MNTSEAFKIVLNLAKQNVVMDPEMGNEYKSQMEAIAIVENIVKELTHDSD